MVRSETLGFYSVIDALEFDPIYLSFRQIMCNSILKRNKLICEYSHENLSSELTGLVQGYTRKYAYNL